MDEQSKHKLAEFRQDYHKAQLNAADLPKDPLVLFEWWFEAAKRAAVPEPNAMTLATSSIAGRPSARVVLLKDYSTKGFSFYTNYQSKKAEDLATNPYGALLFCWLEVEQQIRIEGKVEKLPEAVSIAYFQSRPKGSQIGAWASTQSQPIDSRAVLEQRVKELELQYKDVPTLPKPPQWGGYLVKPMRMEFWQGRRSRLHDRILYELQADNDWTISRLAP